MHTVESIQSEIDSLARDGRPLYSLTLTNEAHEQMRKLVREHLAFGAGSERTAGYFVLWAARYIQSRFPGGQLTWEFVFDGIGLPGRSRSGPELVERGLWWWKRPVRITEAGIHLYLYSLMAEGGLPQALLAQQGLYGRVIRCLIADIETEGDDLPEDLAYRIAARRQEDLPQTFQTDDITRLLSEFGRALVRLRRLPPRDVPAEAIDRWLDRNHPGWDELLPIRLSREVADLLIRPALREERTVVSISKPLAQRVLLSDERSGKWVPFVRLSPQGTVLADLMPSECRGVRLRFQLMGEDSGRDQMVVYSASPVDYGWELHRLGRGSDLLALGLDKPLLLTGYADGRLVGEVEISPAPMTEEEQLTLWKEDRSDESAAVPQELRLMGEVIQTRAPRVWILTGHGISVEYGEGLSVGRPSEAANGWLRSLQGRGTVSFADHTWQIATGADEDCAPVRMLPSGQQMPAWRLAASGGQVYQGSPQFYGQLESGPMRRIQERELRRCPLRTILTESAEWLQRNAVIARSRYVSLPDSVRLTLREEMAGSLTLQAGGFPDGEDWSLTLEAGKNCERIRLINGEGTIRFTVDGSPPGIVFLRIAAAGKGEIRLVTIWPARRGFFLQPDGSRLDRNISLSVGALRGWRAVTPPGRFGELLLKIGRQCIAIRVGGETSIAALVPLIRSMLAYAGPDSKIRLIFVTNAEESPHIDIRRYRQESELTLDGKLRLGLEGGRWTQMGNTRSQDATQNTIELHAVSLERPERIVRPTLEGLAAPVEIDLHSVLPGGEVAWVLQPTLNSQVQRAKVWFPLTSAVSSREQRICEYADEWKQLGASKERVKWKQRWDLILAVMEGGDAGILDQVQALARVPSAAVRLVLRVPETDLSQAMALDMATPVFWPTQPLAAFVEALRAEHECLVEQFAAIGDDANAARDAALNRLARRAEMILLLHPELASHFCFAFLVNGLFELIGGEFQQKLVVAGTVAHLNELAQTAARRLEWLTTGIDGLEAIHRPDGLARFDPHIQKVIEAPLVAAEIAAELRPELNGLHTSLCLMNLRMADPDFFDRALPVALAYVFEKAKL